MEKNTTAQSGICTIIGKEYPISELVNAQSVRGKIKEIIKKSYPDRDAEEGFISVEALNKFRGDYLQKMLEEEKGDLSALEAEVIERINNLETMSKDIDSQVDGKLSCRR